MSKRIISLFISILVPLILLLGGCTANPSADINPEPSPESQAITITDTLNRSITLNGPAKKVVAIGPGALRLYCYVGSIDSIAGIEQIDTESSVGRPYLIANPELTDLQVIGPGGPNNAPDPEKLLSVKPDVIFTLYSTDSSTADSLQAKTGIPVVALSYGVVRTFDPAIYDSLSIIGQATGNEKRADEVIDYIEGCKNELEEKTRDIPDSEKSSSYAGAISYKGTHGIESTFGDYSLFNAVNAYNVVDETNETGILMIDKEKLIEWNPDKIFIDLGGLQMVKDDYNKNRDFYDTLSAFKAGEVYSQLPYNSYHTNIDTSIADAYFIGKVLYPEQFKDMDPAAKADEIYKFLVGKEVYNQMVSDFGYGLEKISFEE